MNKQQRNSPRSLTPLMNEMNIQLPEARYRDGGSELGQFVQLTFLFSPVEAIFPECCQPLDFGQWAAHVPARGVEFIGKCGEVEFLMESLDLRVWDVDFEVVYGGHSVGLILLLLAYRLRLCSCWLVVIYIDEERRSRGKSVFIWI